MKRLVMFSFLFTAPVLANDPPEWVKKAVEGPDNLPEHIKPYVNLDKLDPYAAQICVERCQGEGENKVCWKVCYEN